MEDLHIRAIDPDNASELRALTRLFTNSYGEVYPFKRVFETAFWKRNASSNATCLGIFSGNKLVGHLGTVKSTQFPDCLEIILPSFDSASEVELAAIVEATRSTVYRIASRQNCSAIFSVPFFKNPKELTVFSEVLNLKEACILPVKDTDGQMALQSCWLGFPVLKSARPQQFSRLFVPEELDSIANSLFTQLGLSSKRINQVELPANFERANFVASNNLRLGFSKLKIEMLDQIDPEEHVSSRPSHCSNPYVSISADNPRSATQMQSLINAGYAFCGVLPDFYSLNHFIFSRYKFSSDSSSKFQSTSGQLIIQYNLKNKIDPYANEPDRSIVSL